MNWRDSIWVQTRSRSGRSRCVKATQHRVTYERELSRFYEKLSRYYEKLSNYYEIFSQYNEILSHNYEKVSHYYDLHNFFLRWRKRASITTLKCKTFKWKKNSNFQAMLYQAKLNFDLTNFFYLVDVNPDYDPLNLFRYFTGKANNTFYNTIL